MKVIEELRGREYSLSEIVEYYYKVTESTVAIEVDNKVESSLAYGIQIDKILIEKDGNQNIESEKIDVISGNLELVKEICRIMHKNLVDPIHLLDVLEDNIGKVFRMDSKIKFIENVM